MVTFGEIESKLEKLMRSQYEIEDYDLTINAIRRAMIQELFPTRKMKLVKGKRIEN